MHNTLLLFHICGAVVGILSGFFSLLVRKGGGLHRAAGDIFFISMIVMATCGALIALSFKPNIGNVMGGTLTDYLVITGWLAARSREKRVSRLDYAALAMILIIAASDVTFGIQAATSPTRLKAGYGPQLYFTFGTIALLFAASDLKGILQGGIAGAKRIARHLWRMCLALMMAYLSFYPTRARLFSKAVNDSRILWFPAIFLIVSTIYWLIRIRRGRLHGRPIASTSRTPDWTGNPALDFGRVQR